MIKKCPDWANEDPGWYDSLFCQEARNGNLNNVLDLINLGVDIHAYGESALQGAVSNGHLEIARALLDRGANINVHDDQVFLQSLARGHIKIAILLLERGSNINKMSRDYLRKVLGVNILPRFKNKLIEMMRIIAVHEE